MKLAGIFGAGNIGRGFIGQVFSESGYLVTFVDISRPLVDAINEAGEYPVQAVDDEGESIAMVRPVKAVLAGDASLVSQLVADADILATAVGAHVLPVLAGTLAAGLQLRRQANGSRPVNILVCENLMDAGRKLQGYVKDRLPAQDHAWLDEYVGFVDASIGRMVPSSPEALSPDQPLLVRVEPYKELPVDAAGFRSPVPSIQGMKPFQPFDFYVKRKLYIHNLGHAVIAYLGWLRGYATIDGAAGDPAVAAVARQAMLESAEALGKTFPVPAGELTDHVEDLLKRFANRRLGDTVLRVGRDPLRKLAADDRLAGALKFAAGQGVYPMGIALGLAAALLFDPAGDPTAREVQDRLAHEGIDSFLENHCGIGNQSCYHGLRRMILLFYYSLKMNGGPFHAT